MRCIDVGGPRPENDWDDAVAAHRAEEAGESLRLLYVALTRAQSQVVLWWSPNTTVTNSALHRLAFGRGPGVGQVPDSFRSQRDDDATVRFTAWADQGALVLERADPRTAVGLASHDRVPDLRIADWSRTIDRAWTRTSYTALSTPRDGAAAGAPSQRPGVESEARVHSARGRAGRCRSGSGRRRRLVGRRGRIRRPALSDGRPPCRCHFRFPRPRGP